MMDRSGRLDSTTESALSSTLDSLSLEQGASNSGSAINKIRELALESNIPLVDVSLESLTDHQTISRSATLLGSGLTSTVVKHSFPRHQGAPFQTVALKIPYAHGDSSVSGKNTAREAAYNAAIREIKTFSHQLLLGHPNVVQLLFVGWQAVSPLPILGLEFGPFGSLDIVLRTSDRALSSLQKRHIMIDIPLGLHAIHLAGFAHGDLKTDNIIILPSPNRGGQVIAKISDFGGSSQLGEHNGKPMHFTPLWAAPEVLNEDHDVDWQKADVYSYGLVVASLWAVPNGSASSCVLLSLNTRRMDEELTNSMLWVLKSSPETNLHTSLMRRLEQHLARTKEITDIDLADLLPMLQATLRRHFWLRPSSNDLTKLLEPFATKLERDLQKEKNFLSSGSAGNWRPTFWPSNLWTHMQADPDYGNLTEIQPLSAINTSDIPSTLPEPRSVTNFLMLLQKESRSLMTSTGLDIGPHTTHAAQSNFADQLDKMMKQARQSLLTAMKLMLLESPSVGLGKGFKWLLDAALKGNATAIYQCTLMLIGTDLETKLPIRMFLSVLALSGSDVAMQHLSTCWPDHHRMVRDIILGKPSAYKQLREDTSPDQGPFWSSSLLPYFLTPYSGRSRVTMDEAIVILAVGDLKQDLNDPHLRLDDETSAQGFLHQLAHFPDAEAASLVPIAVKRGARLDVLTPFEPIGCDSAFLFHLRGSQAVALSPVSSAIIGGRPLLALAILDIHISSHIPLPDYPTALELSVECLYSELVEILLKLSKIEPTLCSRENNSRATTELLSGLLLVAMPANTKSFFQRMMHGGQFEAAYEKTLGVLLSEGADPTSQDVKTCPLVLGLARGDAISLRLYLKHLREHDFAVKAFLQATGRFVNCEGYLESASFFQVVCDKIECLKILLSEFPDLAKETVENDMPLLHKACEIPKSNKDVVEVVKLLLNAGADVMAITRRNFSDAFSNRTPICIALENDNTDVANLIADCCSDEQIAILLGKEEITGSSIFSALIAISGVSRLFRPLNSLKWLARRGYAHFHGYESKPVWEGIVNLPRPSLRSDQLQDLEIFEFLLDLEPFRDKIDIERWLGRTLLHAAAFNGHVELVKMLLERKVDVNVKVDGHIHELSHDGWSALDLVEIRRDWSKLPEQVVQGGMYEAKQWRMDLDSIAELLRKAGCEASTQVREESIHKSMNANDWNKLFSRAQEHYIDLFGGRNPQKLLSLSNQPAAWPEVLPQADGGIATTSDINPDDDETDKYDRSNVLRNHRSELETRMFSSEDHAQALALRRRQAEWNRAVWRLSQAWECVELVQDKDQEDSKRFQYRNRLDGSVTFSKPQLIYKDELATSTSPDQYHTTTEIRDKDPDTPIHEAIKDYDIAEVVRLLRITEQVDAKDKDGFTPLQVAIAKIYPGIIRVLAAYGADMDRICAKTGMRPVHFAFHQREPIYLRMVLEALLLGGADPNGTCEDLSTPLNSCLEMSDDAETISMLIKHGAKVNLHSAGPVAYPLFYAITSGREKSLRVLLAARADTNIRVSPGGHSLLHMAAFLGRATMLLDVIQATKDRVETRKIRSMKPLDASSETDSLMLQSLRSIHDTRVLPGDINIDCVNDEGKTPLLMAVMNSQEECVKILLENGADIYKKDHQHSVSPIGAALSFKDLRYLIPLMLAHSREASASTSSTRE